MPSISSNNDTDTDTVIHTNSHDKPQVYIGDHLYSFFQRIGVTEERVMKWLNSQCRCKERQQKLNDLDRLVRQSVKLTIEQAKHYLHVMYEDL